MSRRLDMNQSPGASAVLVFAPRSSHQVRIPMNHRLLPARLDLAQSLSGLVLTLFVAFHLIFDATILFGADAFRFVSGALEGELFFGEKIPLITTVFTAVIFAIFIAHAGLAMRKFPQNTAQYRAYRTHMKDMRHSDTSLWWLQIWTGFAMFFLASVHMYIIMTQPETIGPAGSAYRIVYEWKWPLYLLLTLAVVPHAAIGLYRLALKWGWLAGKNPDRRRNSFKKALWIATAFYITISLGGLGAFMHVGLTGQDHFGNPVEVGKP